MTLEMMMLNVKAETEESARRRFMFQGAHTTMAEMPKDAENLTLATSGEDGSVCERMTFRLHHGQMSAPREDVVRAERFIPHLVARARLVGPTR